MKGKCYFEHLSARLIPSFISFNPNKNFTLRGSHHYFHFTNKDSETREAETETIHLRRVGGRFQTHF